MPPQYFELKRCLTILRHLQRQPCSREALIEFVNIDCTESAYSDFNETRNRSKQFENDISRLRNWGVDIHHHDKDYHLVSYGEFNPVGLSEEDLAALAFVTETFSPGAPNSEAIQHMVRTISDWLPENQRNTIAMRRQRLRIDLRRRDEDEINFKVEDAVNRAIQQRRLLRFSYLSPGQADGVPRLHTVQPWYLTYDTVRHHQYLDAYRLQVAGPYGTWKEAQWQKYRLGRIQGEGIEVLPDKFAALEPKRPRYRLEYLLAPEIARLGEITRHFEDMQVGEADKDGWVQVNATTDDLFMAVRQLLHYGSKCKVTGGAEARREMRVVVEELAKLYE
ncbi:MAG: WYL domain-containing protein [Caldilineaceae bacterium]